MEINYCSRFRVNAAYLFSLCAFVLLGFSAPRCAAAVGPVIKSVTVNSIKLGATTITIPPAGGWIKVTAKVTDTASSLSKVVLNENNRPGYYNPARTAQMTTTDGLNYVANIFVDLNSNSSANGEILYITASDSASNQASLNVATETYSNVSPSVTNVTVNGVTVIPSIPISTAPIGGTVTVTAQIADPALGLKSVILYENNRPGYYNPGRSAPMTTTDGVTYTASIPIDLNQNNGSSGESLYIEAIDPAANQTDTTVAIQGYSSAVPTITLVSISPDPIPVQGATVTVIAKVADPALGLKSVTLYENNRPGYYNPGRTAPMTTTDGVTYRASVPVDLNQNTGANGENLYIEAIDPAANQTDLTVGVQGYSSVAPFGSLPVLITADESVPVLSPSSVSAGGPQLVLGINGINFVSGAIVLFNGVQLPLASFTDKLVTVNIPPSLIAKAGSYAITVVDPSPSGASNSVNFLVK